MDLPIVCSVSEMGNFMIIENEMSPEAQKNK